MVLFKDRRQAVPAMEKLEKWGVVSRPAATPVIGGVLGSSSTAEIDRVALGKTRETIREPARQLLLQHAYAATYPLADCLLNSRAN